MDAVAEPEPSLARLDDVAERPVSSLDAVEASPSGYNTNENKNIAQDANSQEESDSYESDDNGGESPNLLNLKNIVQNINDDKFLCALCGNKRDRKKMTKHLRDFHKIIPEQVNNISSLAKVTKRNKLLCKVCGKNVSCLTKHLMEIHDISRSEALSSMNESRKIKSDAAKSEIKSSEYMLNLEVYSNYCRYSVGYRDVSNYSKSRLTNLEIFGKIVSEILGYDPNDILTIPENDYEIEQSSEQLVSEYINYIKEKNLSANSAIVYLNDIKDLLSVTYRYRARVPLKDFLNRQISNCKTARLGKMDINKYEERVDLVNAIEKHRTCQYVIDIENSIETLSGPR